MIRRFLLLAVGAVAVAAGCSRAPEKLTPEAARARGDELLKEMSKTFSGLQTFAYTADEVREEVKAGKKVEARVTRRVTIRRPNSIAFTTKGDRDAAGWYDGKHLTLVSNAHKAWARGPMPPTLDEALDFLPGRLHHPPAADGRPALQLALRRADDRRHDGGLGGRAERLVRRPATTSRIPRQRVVDWEIWLTQDERTLPCQFQITYKKEPGAPSTRG